MWRITFEREITEANSVTGEQSVTTLSATAECRDKANLDECLYTLENHYTCKNITVEEIAEGSGHG